MKVTDMSIGYEGEEQIAAGCYVSRKEIYTDNQSAQENFKEIISKLCDKLNEKATLEGGIVDWSTMKIESYDGMYKMYEEPYYTPDLYEVVARAKMRTKVLGSIDDEDIIKTIQT